MSHDHATPYADDVELRDVTLRDGLQLTGKLLPTDSKVKIIRTLLALGVPALEIGSMARPDMVPPLADTMDVIAALTPAELARCWIWVATPRHVEKAAAAGARNFQYCFSASDAHNQANIGRSTEDSIAAMPEAVRIAHDVDGEIQLCIATSFTCPFEGPVDPQRVLDIASDPRTDGAADIVLCDTLGQAVPMQVTDLVAAVRDSTPQRRIVFHGHDTWGLGVANTLAAIDAGAVDGRRFARRPRRLPVRAGRKRQHLDGGPAVRVAAGLVHPGHAVRVGAHHRGSARRRRRAEPVQDDSGRPVEGRGIRMGARLITAAAAHGRPASW